MLLSVNYHVFVPLFKSSHSQARKKKLLFCIVIEDEFRAHLKQHLNEAIKKTTNSILEAGTTLTLGYNCTLINSALQVFALVYLFASENDVKKPYRELLLNWF